MRSASSIGTAFWLCLLAQTAWAGPYETLEANVVTTADLSASPDAVTAALSDLAVLAEVSVPTCHRRWALGVDTAGTGARARVSYAASWLARRLTVVVKEVVPGVRVELDHEGPRGFVTRMVVQPGPGGRGSTVTATTYLQQPPKLLRATFFDLVHPAWTACQAGWLQAVDARLDAAPPVVQPVLEPATPPEPVVDPDGEPVVVPTGAVDEVAL